MPTPNTVAATKAMTGLSTLLNQYKPKAEKTADPVIIPMGENLWAKGPAKNRMINMRPLVYTKTKVPETCAVRLSTDSCHWLGPNSVEAVRSMQKAQRMNKGRRPSRNISFVLTFS